MLCTTTQQLTADTLTSTTQWQRPEGDAFVIPLGLIQVRRSSGRLIKLTFTAQRTPKSPHQLIFARKAINGKWNS